MKKGHISLIISFLFVLSIQNITLAQFEIPVKSLCEQLKKKTIIVELKNDSSDIDEVVRGAFKDYWTLTPVEFLSTSEFNKLLSSGDTMYAVFSNSYGVGTHTINNFNTKSGSFEDKGTFYFDHYGFSLSLIDGINSLNKVCTITYAFDKYITSDYLFVIQQLSYLANASLNDVKGLAYFDHKKNIEFVKTKTLLIPKELFKEKDLLKLKDKYPYPFKIVTTSEMNDLVLAKSEEFIYPKIIFCLQQNFYGWVTINAKDGKVTSIMTFGGIQVRATVKCDELIKVEHLKYVASEMAQGINNKYK